MGRRRPAWQFAVSSSSVTRYDNSCDILKKYAIPPQIKPGIPKLTIRRGQSNLNIVFIFVRKWLLSCRFGSVAI